MHLILYIIICTCVTVGCESFGFNEEETGRKIVFWNGGTIKFIVGWSIPVPTNHTPFVTLFTHGIQMAYPTISNASMLTDLLQQGLAKGVRYTKRNVYYLLDRFITSYGRPNRQCLTRFFCELSQISIGHNFAGALLEYIFTPDEEDKYKQAWRRGIREEDCEEFYYCPYAHDILSQFTTIQYL